MSRRFDDFRARIEGRGKTAGNPGSEPDDTDPKPEVEREPGEEQENEPMTTETPLEEREDYKAGHSAGAKAANDRMNTVFAHENAKGREAAAARLLGTAMTADEITTELAHQPKAEPAAELSDEDKRKAAEEGGRQEMREAIGETGNSGLDASGGGKKNTEAEASAIWDQAIASTFPNSKAN